jgi:hypothetical protein
MPNCKSFSNKHILTANIEDLPPEIAKMAQYGTKIRYHLRKEDVLETARIGVQEYADKTIEKARKKDGLNAQMVVERTAAARRWVEHMQRELKAAYDRNEGDAKVQESLDKKRILLIKKFQEDFAVGTVDKTGHNLWVCCKHEYKRIMCDEMRSTSYGRVQENEEEILAQHAQYNRENRFEHGNILMYLHGQTKFHKTPPGWRFIGGK